MSILRAAALVLIIVFCGAFVPVGGCAKGCGQAGKMAAREGDNVARLSTPGIAAGGAYADDLARGGRVGQYGDDLGRTGRAGDEMVATGAHTDDLAHAADDFHASGFASELESSGIKLTDKQHDEVLDAVKDAGQEILGQLADGDDSDDDADMKRTAKDLDKRLQATLTREQLRKFHAQFGTSKQLVERLSREHAGGSAQP